MSHKSSIFISYLYCPSVISLDKQYIFSSNQKNINQNGVSTI